LEEKTVRDTKSNKKTPTIKLAIKPAWGTGEKAKRHSVKTHLSHLG